MSKLTLSYSDLYTTVSNFLGLTDSGTAPTGQDLIDCKDIVARGLRQFLYPIDIRYGTPHHWSFLEQYWSFSTVADKWKYALPMDFSDLLMGFSFDDSKALPPLKKRSGQQIKEMRSISDTSGWPMYFAVVPSKYDLATGTTYELWLYPTPSQAYTLSTFYRIDPLRPSGTTDLAVGGISATEAILESCLAIAETQKDDNTSTHHQAEAKRLIQTLIIFDSGKTASGLIGNLYENKFYKLDEDTLLVQDIDFDRDVYA